MCLSPALPSGEDLARHQLELQQILGRLTCTLVPAGGPLRLNLTDTAWQNNDV